MQRKKLHTGSFKEKNGLVVLSKYCSRCRKHCAHKETKVKDFGRPVARIGRAADSKLMVGGSILLVCQFDL